MVEVQLEEWENANRKEAEKGSRLFLVSFTITLHYVVQELIITAVG